MAIPTSRARSLNRFSVFLAVPASTFVQLSIFLYRPKRFRSSYWSLLCAHSRLRVAVCSINNQSGSLVYKPTIQIVTFRSPHTR